MRGHRLTWILLPALVAGCIGGPSEGPAEPTTIFVTAFVPFEGDWDPTRLESALAGKGYGFEWASEEGFLTHPHDGHSIYASRAGDDARLGIQFRYTAWQACTEAERARADHQVPDRAATVVDRLMQVLRGAGVDFSGEASWTLEAFDAAGDPVSFGERCVRADSGDVLSCADPLASWCRPMPGSA